MFRDVYRHDPSRCLRLGILKGGQLGRMLMQACMNYDLQGVVMDKDPQSPCAHFCSEFISGDCCSYDDVYRFGKMVDVLTLEVEEVNVEALKQLEQEGLRIYPQPSIIELIQDKGLQKNFYKKNGFPTADFVFLAKDGEREVPESFFPAVQKLRRSGYDGKGVKMVRTKADLASAFNQESLLEKKVDFIKEISVIVARNQSGECAVYPAAELVSDPKQHLLDLLVAPAEISITCQNKAQKLAIAVIEKLGLVGLLAVEMFVTADESVLVNEIAPRPHNSGHHTIESNVTSQFEQHLRAIMNLPLGSTALRSKAVMVNVLGEPGFSGVPIYDGINEVLAVAGAYLHLYGKSRTEPFRKMGHVTILDEDLTRAKEKALWIKKKLRVRA